MPRIITKATKIHDSIVLIVASTDPAVRLRSAQLAKAVEGLGFHGSPRQLEAFYRCRVLGHTLAAAAQAMQVGRDSVAKLLARFAEQCQRPIPIEYRHAPPVVSVQLMETDKLDRLGGTPYSSLAG